MKHAAFPDGHFYSPVVDVDDVAARRSIVWPPIPEVLGIDFNDTLHESLLTTDFPKYLPDYDYPESLAGNNPGSAQFYTRNSQFSWLDSRTLFVLMRSLAPKHIIEVGSGYSSLLMADVNRRFFGGSIEIACIEPYPRDFLKGKVDGLSQVVISKVQDVTIESFEQLEAGDFLFIDTSHVAKTGSDVNFLYFEVLPRLRDGVFIHVHDIFFPHEYPENWVLGENRSWNEQYILRALLMYSAMFHIFFGCSYAFFRYPDLVMKALAHPRGCTYGGGSIWLRKGR